MSFENELTELSGSVTFVVLVTVLIFLAYCYLVPFACTGLWALIFDPVSTLLARELTMKLADPPISGKLIGLFGNSIAPVLIFLAAMGFVLNISHRKYWHSALFLMVVMAAALLVFLPGIKGLLIPSILLSLIGTLSFPQTYVRRMYAVTFAMLVAIGFLGIFELLREIPPHRWATNYQYGQCASDLKACAPAYRLLDSARMRTESLGLKADRIDLYYQQLNESSCSGGGAENAINLALEQAELVASKVQDFGRVSTSKNIELTRGGEELYFNTDKLMGGRALRLSVLTGVKFFERIEDNVMAIFDRAMRVPIQAAIWHFLYTTEFQSPGWSGISLPRRIVGETVNMPELVYQTYGTIYSNGDMTSTSTTPTAFFYAYPAYLGFVGLLFAIIISIAYDCLAIGVIASCNGYNRLAAYGLFAVTAFNMMSSDFITVMLTHGAIASIILLLCLELVRRRYFLVKSN